MADINSPDVRVVEMGNGVTQTITTEVKENEHETVTSIHTETQRPVHKEDLQQALNGEQAQASGGESAQQKTPEQEANLAMLREAKEFMTNTEVGRQLAADLLNQEGGITGKQKRLLKRNGIDPDAFIQEWNKANAGSKNNKHCDAAAAAENLDDMGALANAHLGEDTKEHPQNRAVKKDIEVRNPENRTLLQKMFTQKEKQVVADSKQYVQNGGTKVDIHSATSA